MSALLNSGIIALSFVMIALGATLHRVITDDGRMTCYNRSVQFWALIAFIMALIVNITIFACT